MKGHLSIAGGAPRAGRIICAVADRTGQAWHAPSIRIGAMTVVRGQRGHRISCAGFRGAEVADGERFVDAAGRER